MKSSLSFTSLKFSHKANFSVVEPVGSVVVAFGSFVVVVVCVGVVAGVVDVVVLGVVVAGVVVVFEAVVAGVAVVLVVDDVKDEKANTENDSILMITIIEITYKIVLIQE